MLRKSTYSVLLVSFNKLPAVFSLVISASFESQLVKMNNLAARILLEGGT